MAAATVVTTEPWCCSHRQSDFTSLTSLSHTLGQSSEQKGLAEQADDRRVQAEQVHGFLASMMAGGLL